MSNHKMSGINKLFAYGRRLFSIRTILLNLGTAHPICFAGTFIAKRMIGEADVRV